VIPACSSKRVILCIDDDEAILLHEKALLERSGYAVLIASSAQLGLSLLTACDFDAVILDYEMPDMNGYDVASEIKWLRPELVVILFSGGEVPIEALALVDAFLPKPDASQELLPMIATLCSRMRDPRPRQAVFLRNTTRIQDNSS